MNAEVSDGQVRRQPASTNLQERLRAMQPVDAMRVALASVENLCVALLLHQQWYDQTRADSQRSFENWRDTARSLGRDALGWKPRARRFPDAIAQNVRGWGRSATTILGNAQEALDRGGMDLLDGKTNAAAGPHTLEAGVMLAEVESAVQHLQFWPAFPTLGLDETFQTLNNAVKWCSKKCAELGVAVRRHNADQVAASRPALTPVTVPVPAAPPSVLARSGGVWHIEFAGQQTVLKDFLGLSYIQTLLNAPNPKEPIPCAVLAPDPTAAAGDMSFQQRLDPPAMAELRSRGRELRDEIKTNANVYPEEELTRMKDELAAITERVAADIGLSGRSRGMDLRASERRRKRVRSAIARAVEKLSDSKDGLPALAAHLNESINGEGDGFAYRPGPKPPDWRLT